MAYSSSNARIHLYKTQDYILTSVQSPRTDGGSMWSPVPQEILEDTSLDTLVIRNKAMNECFHETSHFQPGVYAISSTCATLLWIGKRWSLSTTRERLLTCPPCAPATGTATA